MKSPLHTADIFGKLVMLGTGTSVGVPAIGCGCPVCLSDNPKNKRMRCSVVFGLPQGNLLIDTPPDLRTQLLREGIGVIHAVAYTHEHADHLMGLDDLRLFPYYIGGPVPVYCEERVEHRIRRTFDYAFSAEVHTHEGAAPKLDLRRIGLAPFQALGATIHPIRLKHGPRFDVLGFRIRDVAYCTDVNLIPEESWEMLTGLDVLIIDALRLKPHATHFSLAEAIAAAERVRPRRTIFTHISHDLDHDPTNAQLPPGMELGYDGLKVEVK